MNSKSLIIIFLLNITIFIHFQDTVTNSSPNEITSTSKSHFMHSPSTTVARNESVRCLSSIVTDNTPEERLTSKKLLTDAVNEKFGNIPEVIAASVKRVRDEKFLDALFKKVFHCQTIDEFSEAFRQAKI